MGKREEVWYLLPSNPTGPWNPIPPCSPLEPGGAGMPPLPWSPGSPGEPLKPYTTMVVSTVTADISTCPSHLVNMCSTCVCLVLSAGFTNSHWRQDPMVLAQAKSTKFIGKGCWDQDNMSPTTLILHSWHHLSLMRLMAKVALHQVHTSLTLCYSLSWQHSHKDVHFPTKHVQSWFVRDPYLTLLWLRECYRVDLAMWVLPKFSPVLLKFWMLAGGRKLKPQLWKTKNWLSFLAYF